MTVKAPYREAAPLPPAEVLSKQWEALKAEIERREDIYGHQHTQDGANDLILDAILLLKQQLDRIEERLDKIEERQVTTMPTSRGAKAVDCWTEARERLLHGLYHIRDLECDKDHDESGEPCPRRIAKETIDNRPCSICDHEKGGGT
jgi:hypothetical protein